MTINNTSNTLFAEHPISAAELINPKGKAPIILVCEHASNYIPDFLNDLGLNDRDKRSHAAWDIGAYDLACSISQYLDTPLIAAKVSRLVYDCNRSPQSGLGMPSVSEKIIVKGNENLSDADIADRVQYVYEPFHQLIDDTINNSKRLGLSDQHATPTIITIHSFTPVYFNEQRRVELGILHDEDDRLAKAMMNEAKKRLSLKAEFNSPYSPSDNVMHTVNRHAPNQDGLKVMIEVKNDLLSNKADIDLIAKDLSMIIRKALQQLNSMD